jgi:hypothetical protein
MTSLNLQTGQTTDAKIPQTGDGQIIYPGMPVFICEPYSIEKLSKATVYCVIGENNQYYCILEENRCFDGEYWDDGNTEHVSRVFADCQQCLVAVSKIESESD